MIANPDDIMFYAFVLPAIARQARDSTPDKHAAESAAFSEIAASPYAHLCSVLHVESSK